MLEFYPKVNQSTCLKKIVGDDLVEKIEFQSLAIQIVEKCAGLPLVIASIASALRKRSRTIW